MAKRHIDDGPVALTDANRLYLYKLLGEALGIGRQTFLPRALEALAAEGITPENLGHPDAQALFSTLSDFCQLTAFKGGRFYVTVTRREDWDQVLAATEAPRQGSAGKGGKPWKRKKGALKPSRPKTRQVEAKKEPEPEVGPEQPKDTADVNALEVGGAAEAQTEKAEPVAAETGEEARAEGQPAAPSDAGEADQTSEPAQAAKPEAQPEPSSPAPASSGIPSILEQIAATSVAPVAAPKAVTSSPHADLPRSFSDDVSIKPALLGLLTSILPFDADLMAVLDEDWRVARATGTTAGSRNLVTFPLRYLQEDGSEPVRVTIRRTARPGDARRWHLTLVDGDDGTGQAHEAAGIEGLPEAEGGYWCDLSPRPAAGTERPDPIRDLAQLMEIGTWNQALGTLATAAAPERWNYPGEGVGKASRYGILREYLSATLARARAEGRLATSADGSLAAFDTGLMTPMDEELYAVLSPTGTDIPWHLDGFATAGAGELGSRLVASLSELPARATYLASVDDVALRDGALTVADYRSLLGDGLARLPQGFLSAQLDGTDAAHELDGLSRTTTPQGRRDALRRLSRAITGEPGRYRRICRAIDDAIDLAQRRARQSYRLVAPAYDAARDRMVLLLPLALVDDARTDCALVLELMPSGAYQAARVTTLAHAYAAARVVSREMPGWLSPEDVLA
ncbi:DUF3825 domain-containing protein [uncultured Parolsenella sp.]|uniref:DUF3825 domain-containing protein n=1 Tax=uncultured Parolsenella sp. TaxID=2083008 RepID=UPI0025F970EE|nr:DUF3825 domain-containing protein [uncultured Parolsenella sp.]